MMPEASIPMFPLACAFVTGAIVGVGALLLIMKWAFPNTREEDDALQEQEANEVLRSREGTW